MTLLITQTLVSHRFEGVSSVGLRKKYLSISLAISPATFIELQHPLFAIAIHVP